MESLRSKDSRAAQRAATVALASLSEVLSVVATVACRRGQKAGKRALAQSFPWHTLTREVAADNPPEDEGPAAAKAPKHSPRPRMRACPPKPEVAARQPRRQCHCGRCRECRDNARWESIFEAKFADPDYYRSALTIRYSSPLYGL